MLRLYNPRPSEPCVNWPWTIGTLSAYGFALLALVWLAIANPKISVWISEAAEAELAAAVPPAAAPETHIAQPAGSVQSTQLAERLYK
jgi:hypothetical protein